jgi:hypothetical protein
MPLDEKEIAVIRDALITIGEERIRLDESINWHVTEAIKLRAVQHKLEMRFDRLAEMVYKSKEQMQRDVDELKKKPG